MIADALQQEHLSTEAEYSYLTFNELVQGVRVTASHPSSCSGLHLQHAQMQI